MTLIEVSLVLALLVVIGAIAYPNIQAPFARQRVRKAAELVRVELAKGRNMAMRTGRIMVFQCTLQSGRFETVPFARQEDLVEGDLATTRTAGAGPLSTGVAPSGLNSPIGSSAVVRAGQLPRRIVFAQVAVGSDARSQMTLQGAGSGLSSSIGIPTMTASSAAPIVLYPDGTTSDAKIIVSDADGRASLITVRGLTGMTRAVDWTPRTAQMFGASQVGATGGASP